MIIENLEGFMSTIYSGITSVSSFILGLFFGNVALYTNSQELINGNIISGLQCLAFIVSIIAGLITIFKGFGELKKRSLKRSNWRNFNHRH
jgi:hypothetical protein